MPDITADQLRALFKRAEEEQAFWTAHYDEFLSKYPNQFVAVLDGEVVATSAHLQELELLLRERGLKPTDVWTEYFDPDPLPWIL
jgi:hypothetical protein